MKSKKSAFTLAEVLITLSIIGVIAAITIPSLLQSTQKQELVAGLKKAYATLSQAYTLVSYDYDGDITTLFPDSSAAASANAMNVFAKKLNVIKNCGSGMGCWYTTETRWINGTLDTNNTDLSLNNYYGKAILADGSMIYLNSHPYKCENDYGDRPLSNVCGNFAIDINGPKKPNTLGRDVFFFWITKNGIYPAGSYNDSYTCDPTYPDPDTPDQSWGCAAKVLQEGAMNY